MKSINNKLFNEIQKLVQQQHREHEIDKMIRQQHTRQTKQTVKQVSGDNPPFGSTIAYELGWVETAETYSNIHEDDPQEDANYIERNGYMEEEL